MSWWELEYEYDIGAAVYVPFVRPLYPADHEDGPVPDGPDVEAVKRIAWKLGRWTPPPHDRAYSNKFAHGKSGNVGESGWQGVQRQAGVAKASGAYGERSHHIAIYARIPEGRDNAGRFACDDYEVALFQEAARLFPPKDEAADEPPSGDSRGRALDHLDERVGYTEDPARSNCDSRPDGIRTAQDHCAGGGTWLRYEPWCGCWCYYALEAAGVKGIDSHLASVASIEDAARAGSKCYRGWTTDRSQGSAGRPGGRRRLRRPRRDRARLPGVEHADLRREHVLRLLGVAVERRRRVQAGAVPLRGPRLRAGGLPVTDRWRERLRRIMLATRRRERRAGEWLEPGSDERMDRSILLRLWDEHDRREATR